MGLNRNRKIKKVADENALSKSCIAKHKLSFDLGFFRSLRQPLVAAPQIKDWNKSKDAFFVGGI